ncbi:MAG: Fe-S cluster assembly protein SufD [Candidatus Marinimicrobia bacterium]|nr:Fe-S cluster assembly protein SufD [Candidatus Neomarinimicrobiota bacterium]
MTETLNIFKDWVQDQSRKGSDFVLSKDFRQRSLSEVRTENFPTRKNEEWRYTPLSSVFDRQPSFAAEAEVNPADVEQLTAAFADAHHLVFIDGHFNRTLSDEISVLARDGIAINLLEDLEPGSQDEVERVIKNAKLTDDNIFRHITQGLARTGLFIELQKNIEITKPLHLLFLGTQSGKTTLSNPINVVHLNPNSRLKIIQQFASVTATKALTIPADYFQIDEGAALEIYKLGLESDETDHLSNTYAQLADAGSLNHHQYLFGSRFTRTNTEINFAGSGSEVVLRGIYLGDKSQHLDIRTYVDHAQPNCMSDQHFRGIMNDHSRGVFNGLVLVREHAQKTNAQQSNKNLLLSRDARVDTKPQLEIHADDVKCAHGATIGELDENALFYLQSRGISKQDAALMLTRAFATEITQEVKLDSLREYIQAEIEARLMEAQNFHV